MLKLKNYLAKIMLVIGLTAIVMMTPLSVYAETIQRPDDWATHDLYEAESSGILPLDWQQTLHQPINHKQLEYIKSGLEKKFVQAGLSKQGNIKLVEGNTRESILKNYYELLLAYGKELDLKTNYLEYMIDHKIVAGDTKGNINKDKPCTVQEATLFANRILKDVYKQLDEGAKGYLWKVAKGNHTVYLLGTVHVAQEKIYPFSNTLNEIIKDVDKVAFEVDFNDQKGMSYLIQKQMYLDGTTLKDHIPLELYNEVVNHMKKLGIPESETMKYKPWALTNAITTLSANDTSAEEIETGAEYAIPIIDAYVYTKSLIQDKDIIELEGYVFQADMFDSVSLAHQIESLEGSLQMANKEMSEEASQEQDESTSLDITQYWVDAFIEGDIEGFVNSYPKDQILEAGDEMAKLLFIERDEHMTKKVVEYLSEKGDSDYLIVVGAGHMIGKTGIVNSLIKLGYDVKPVK